MLTRRGGGERKKKEKISKSMLLWAHLEGNSGCLIRPFTSSVSMLKDTEYPTPLMVASFFLGSWLLFLWTIYKNNYSVTRPENLKISSVFQNQNLRKYVHCRVDVSSGVLSFYWDLSGISMGSHCIPDWLRAHSSPGCPASHCQPQPRLCSGHPTPGFLRSFTLQRMGGLVVFPLSRLIVEPVLGGLGVIDQALPGS